MMMVHTCSGEWVVLTLVAAVFSQAVGGRGAFVRGLQKSVCGLNQGPKEVEQAYSTGGFLRSIGFEPTSADP